MKNILNQFKFPLVATIAGLILAFMYGGATAVIIAGILTILEVSLSFDNAVVNATVLEKMNAYWQKIFLSIGIIIAVFGMRMLFPLLVVGITGHLSPGSAISLAMAKGDPEVPGTYGYILAQAHPAIAAFGGIFLLMIFLDFVFEERKITWLSWLERPLAKVGHLDQLSTVIGMSTLAAAAMTFANEHAATVLLSGILGMALYIMVNAAGDYFNTEENNSTATVVLASGKAAFMLFLYLELLDASFSFDGVMGAFAITSDPIIIALGLGIGACYIRALTVYLVRQGTLKELVHLEHGAHWAIGALAIILLYTIKAEVSEVVTGLLGVGFIGASYITSVVARRRRADDEPATADEDMEPVATV